MTDADATDVVLVVCPRCRVRGSRGVIGRVVRDRGGRHQLVTVQTARTVDERRFGDDRLLRADEFVAFVFDRESAEKGLAVDVECRHGRRAVQRSRLEREIALHAPGKPPRILVSEPPAH